MNSLELQEKTINTILVPFFSNQGYQAMPSGKEFRKITSNGFRSILFSLSIQENQQLLDIRLGTRLDIIENLVAQFLKQADSPPESHTILASPHLFNRPPLNRFKITDEASLQLSCNEIKDFMQKKGFRFLNTFTKLKRVDAVLNRKPDVPNPYIHNQIHRCFIGVTLARLLQRTDFQLLCVVYGNFLYSLGASDTTMESFQKLVTYLNCFSFN